jgi:hypothetical protein
MMTLRHFAPVSLLALSLLPLALGSTAQEALRQLYKHSVERRVTLSRHATSHSRLSLMSGRDR